MFVWNIRISLNPDFWISRRNYSKISILIGNIKKIDYRAIKKGKSEKYLITVVYSKSNWRKSKLVTTLLWECAENDKTFNIVLPNNSQVESICKYIEDEVKQNNLK